MSSFFMDKKESIIIEIVLFISELDKLEISIFRKNIEILNKVSMWVIDLLLFFFIQVVIYKY
jgi:hypothetical protein